MITKPFIKWAGGKTKFIPEFSKSLPDLVNNEFDFVEPFVGGGAILFWMLNRFDNLNNIIINDNNEMLMNVYETLKDGSVEFKNVLRHLDYKYNSYDEKARTDLYYSIRGRFNDKQSDNVMMAAYFIFLNKTCFNGLYRVNKAGEFNVPKGVYKKPKIFDEKNLDNVIKNLKKVQIYSEPFENMFKFANRKTLFYLDPPYINLDNKKNFTSYTKEGFDVDDHKKLKDFCTNLNEIGAKFILNNSDSTLSSEIFKDFNIRKIEMPRSINSDGNGRRAINEILITNF